jgi:TolA-binding protein
MTWKNFLFYGVNMVCSKKYLSVGFILVSTLFSGCMTSERQEELQSSIDKLQGQVTRLQSQVSSKDDQIKNTTQTAIDSQTEAQNLKDQLQLTQGALDEVKMRLKKIEETSGSNALADSTLIKSEHSDISANSVNIFQIQKKIAILELLTKYYPNPVRKGKLPAKLKNEKDMNKSIKANMDKGNFKQVVLTTTTILGAADASDSMLALAYEYRGEAKFQMQDYHGAALDLSTELVSFSNTPRKARALLLAGDSYVYLKNNSIAALYYDECAKSFPTETEGKAASSRLASLQSKNKPASSTGKK